MSVIVIDVRQVYVILLCKISPEANYFHLVLVSEQLKPPGRKEENSKRTTSPFETPETTSFLKIQALIVISVPRAICASLFGRYLKTVWSWIREERTN